MKHQSIDYLSVVISCSNVTLFQAVISVFLAAGFSVILGWSKSEVDVSQDCWMPLDNI